MMMKSAAEPAVMHAIGCKARRSKSRNSGTTDGCRVGEAATCNTTADTATERAGTMEATAAKTATATETVTAAETAATMTAAKPTATVASATSPGQRHTRRQHTD
jgi:hypothetical protein